MTKRTRRTRSQSSLFRQLLYILFVLVLALFYYAIETQTDLLDETADNPTQTPAGPVQTPSGTEVAASGDWYELYFTQRVNSDEDADHHNSALEQALIRQIDATQRTIDAALFELDAPDTTAALERAIQRGVKVRLVVDNEHALEDPASTLQTLIDAGAEVKDDDRSALMHNKYLIFDNAAVWTGSTNVTRNGIYNNDNNALLIRAPEVVANYQADFEEMFTDEAFTVSVDTRDIVNRVVTINGTQIETYFTPDDKDEIRPRIIELIQSADTSIRVMPFSFTLEGIGTAMLDRLAAGVQVRGVFETTGSLQGQMPVLACAGAEVRQDGNPGIMHHKVIIIDDETVITGSFNFSNSAIEDNSENFLIIHDPQIAAAYIAEFEERFTEGRVPSAEDLDC